MLRSILSLLILTLLVVAGPAVNTLWAGPVASDRFSRMDSSRRQAIIDLNGMHPEALATIREMAQSREIRRMVDAVLQQPFIVDADGKRRFLLGDEADLQTADGRNGEVGYEIDHHGRGRFFFMERHDDGTLRRSDEPIIQTLNDSLSVGARRTTVMDEETGRGGIHQWLMGVLGPDSGRFEQLEYIESLKGRVLAPVDIGNLLRPIRSDERTELTVDGQSWSLAALWPNGIMPSLIPEGGLERHLVYVGQADWDDLTGLDLRNSIAVMNFGGGRNFERLFGLGVRAVIVLEGPPDSPRDQVTRERAEALFANTPIPAPRFYLSHEEIRRVVEAGGPDFFSVIGARDRDPQADAPERITGRVTGGQVFEYRPHESLFFYLPPTEPLVINLAADELLRRIATQFATETSRIILDNPDVDFENLRSGTSLIISARQTRYTVAEDDLARRLAAQYGLANADVLRSANGLESGSPLPVGELTIPNLDQSMLLTVAIDSVSVAPDAPHGATVATNIAAAIRLLEYLGREGSGTAPNVRRKGLVVAFMDAEYLGGYGSKLFAQNVLQVQGRLTGLGEGDKPFPVFGLIFGLLIAGGIGWLIGFVLAGGDPDNPNPMSKRWLPATVTALFFGIFGGVIVTIAHQREGLLGAVLPAEQRLAYYTEVKDWVENPTPEGLSSDAAEWFVTDWLTRRVEAARADRADAAAAIGRRQAGLPRGSEEFIELERQIRQAEEVTLGIADMRDQTLLNRSYSWSERAYRFWTKVRDDEEAGRQAHPTLSIEQFVDRLLAEYREERTENDFVRHNRRVIGQMVQKLHPSAVPAEGEPFATGSPVTGWQLSLSDGSPSMGLTMSEQRPFRILPTVVQGQRSHQNSIQARMREVMIVATVRGNWQRDWMFLTSDDTTDHPFEAPRTPVHYSEFWTAANVGIQPMVTMNEQHIKLDTPRDVPERLAANQLEPQLKTAMTLLSLGLESHLDSAPITRLPTIGFGRLQGRILQFNARSGIDAQDPVPDVLVYSPNLPRNSGQVGLGVNSSTQHGGRRGVIALSRGNGSFNFPVESVRTIRDMNPRVYAYGFDHEAGLVNRVANESQIGTQTQRFDFTLTADRVSERDLIVTEVYPWVFAPGVEPVGYKAVATQAQPLVISDAVTGALPEHFGIDNPLIRYGETATESNILYMRPNRRVRIVAQHFTTFPMLLTGPLPAAVTTADDEASRFRSAVRGVGYRIGPRNGDPNVFLELTPLAIASDMGGLAGVRQAQYEARNLRDQSIDEALIRSNELLEQARAAVDEKNWQAAFGNARASWGMVQRAYPRILQLGREAIFSAVILMGLLVPACWFLERLVIGSKTIIAKLIGTTILFVLAVGFLQLTHPALLIAVSPFIVMVSFVMILMALVVLGICYQRFDVLVRRARASAGEVESEEISLMASLATALSLGVSNLKKRPSRTFLTSLTVTVLTFSIITFVSVSGRDTLMQRAVTLEDQIEGRAVEPLPPQFQGVLFRNYNWRALDREFISAIQSEFGDEFEVSTRGFWIEVEGGNNADREGRNQIAIRRMPDQFRVQPGQTVAEIAELTGADAARIRLANVLGEDREPMAGDVLQIPHAVPPVILTGIMAFEPQERRFSRIHETVSNQQWFSADDPYPFQIILPDTAAEELGITPADIYEGTPEQIAAGQGVLRPRDQLPTVSMRNVLWRVIGIMETGEADRVRDLTGRSLAMVDFLKSAFTPAASGELLNEGPSYSFSWERLVTIPMIAADRMTVQPRSIAIRFDPDRHSAERIEQFRRDIEKRVDFSMFGTFDNQLSLVTSRTQNSVAGLAKVIVPVLLCILIVLNTMMGAVDERKGEVAMLGAIGLSPNQISFLLLSESMVYSVLGIIFGTLTGLAFAWAIPAADRFFDVQILTALSFNFTSVIAMLLAMGTGMVVLVATLIPARKAAALAAPSGMAKWDLPDPNADGHILFNLPFTLTRGNAVGMMAFFRRFLLNHGEATSTDFNCRDVRLARKIEGAGALEITCNMWLAPYDLDVSQHLRLNVHPTENPGVFGVAIDLERTGGTEESWSRTNYGFLNMVRQQFLLWRNLDDASRAKVIQEGAGLFKEATN